MNDNTILSLEGLCAGYGSGDVISDMSFSLGRGESLCIVGQSGCGKSTLLKAVLGIFDLPKITGGDIVFDSQRLSELPPKRRAELVSSGMGLIFQTPGAAFNPIRSYKKQFIETLKSHGKYDKNTFLPSVRDVFARLGLEEHERILASCPYEMSGGMNQRIALALVMLMQQELLLADEPTSALDAATRRTVADELISMRTDGLSQLIVTHDLALAAYIADRIAVMHRGKIVELAPARELLDAPLHSYTKALLKTAPRLGGELPAAAENSEAYSGLLTELSPGHFVLMEVQHGQYTER
ncbi:MAG: ABC transporter ATP-binding protein [Oscillospiraceae bacterium]|nr:ABC transporter ATP-binding protein [Oscillospiraceae bacterium]